MTSQHHLRTRTHALPSTVHVVRIPTLCLLAATLITIPVLAQDSEPIPGIGPIGPLIKLHTGFKFTEGPAADAHGNVFFTDIPNGRIHKLDTDNKLTVFREPSGHANGLMFDAKGRLVACEMDGRLTATATDGAATEVLADKYDGKRFNSTNDLVIDRTGGIYFTDPSYRSPKPYPQGTLAVYYRAPDGKISRIIESLPNPNGIILSPDEKILYVIPSSQAEMMAYPVQAPGKIGKGRTFCTLKQPPGQTKSGGDGLTVDTNGNLYITSGLGLQVFSPKGKRLGIIKVPEKPANVTFGGPDMKTLYITARTSLYIAKMTAKGHRFATGK